jgi:hypothetical protein
VSATDDPGVGTGAWPDQLHGMALALRKAQFEHATDGRALDELTVRGLTVVGGILVGAVHRGRLLVCYVAVTAYGAFVDSPTFDGAVDGARRVAQREDRMMFGYSSG